MSQFPGPVKFPMNTTKIAQYAADAAKSSCRAALVSRLMAALNKSVNTINTPTALNVSRLLTLAAPALTAAAAAAEEDEAAEEEEEGEEGDS